MRVCGVCCFDGVQHCWIYIFTPTIHIYTLSTHTITITITPTHPSNVMLAVKRQHCNLTPSPTSTSEAYESMALCAQPTCCTTAGPVLVAACLQGQRCPAASAPRLLGVGHILRGSSAACAHVMLPVPLVLQLRVHQMGADGMPAYSCMVGWTRCGRSGYFV